MENYLEIKKMQKIAGVITEGEYRMIIEALHDETLDESLKSWLVGGLLTLTTLAGIGKVYQMDQQAKTDRTKKTEYYNDILSKELAKLDDQDFGEMGYDINEKTHDRATAPGSTLTPQEVFDSMASYGKDYIKTHPDEFSVGEHGGIFWNKGKWSFDQFKNSKYTYQYK
jgi:hypothetical protein